VKFYSVKEVKFRLLLQILDFLKTKPELVPLRITVS
jgi:hypothetical protein